MTDPVPHPNGARRWNGKVSAPNRVFRELAAEDQAKALSAEAILDRYPHIDRARTQLFSGPTGDEVAGSLDDLGIMWVDPDPTVIVNLDDLVAAHLIAAGRPPKEENTP